MAGLGKGEHGTAKESHLAILMYLGSHASLTSTGLWPSRLILSINHGKGADEAGSIDSVELRTSNVQTERTATD